MKTAMRSPRDHPQTLPTPGSSFASKSYKEWLARDDAVKTPMGHCKKAPLSEVATWVKDAWEDLPADIIQTGFKKCCISNALDGTEDDVVWRAEDAGEDASEASDDDSFSGSSDDDAACGSKQGKVLSVLVEKFNNYFVPRRNEVYARYLLQCRKQELGEAFDAFLKDLKAKAKNCN
ncbi:hypothetical protein HPB47_007046 [Ixodes persulcatus]|uniref:Uncharacterized protein n=1 Tax=Ixodes persulcatus TaxID=34615 RepID=A0AC60P900_IXOPE|nr:hypothetical protein HPB47_007046 [Ixodes persulcatus]